MTEKIIEHIPQTCAKPTNGLQLRLSGDSKVKITFKRCIRTLDRVQFQYRQYSRK